MYTAAVELVRTVRRLVGTIHVGAVQGAFTHAEHRVRTIRSSEHNGRLADDDQYADRSDVLRAVRGALHDAHPVVGRFQTPL